MKKITEYLSKPIINLTDCKIEGYVKTLYFDNNFKQLKWIAFFDNDEQEEEKIVKASDVFSVGEDAIVIKNASPILLKTAVMLEKESPINSLTYSTLGKKIGTITDIFILENNKVEFIKLDNGQQISSGNIARCGNGVVIMQDNNVKVNISKFRSKKPSILSTDIKVSIQAKEAKKQSIIPQKIVDQNFTFLIGRKVYKNIYAENNSLIIKKETKVNAKIVELASKNGRLRELTMFSK